MFHTSSPDKLNVDKQIKMAAENMHKSIREKVLFY